MDASAVAGTAVKTRVLIVDDAVIIRRLLTDCLSSEPDIEVVGHAANGLIALERLEQLRPDVVTLDIEMPEMSGIETLIEIRKRAPTLPVIMFSSHSENGAVATLDALAHGASDYVTKPANVRDVTEAQAEIRAALLPRIRNLCGKSPRAGRSAASTEAALPSPPSAARPPEPLGEVDIVVVGSSTGGPNALMALLGGLQSPLPVPMLIVQHMPPVFTRHLATRLTAATGLRVREAAGGEPLRAGEIWIAPGDFHLEVQRRGSEVVTHLQQGPQENSCRPAVDVLFRSVSQVYGGRALAVVLTGMGQDGGRGAEALCAAGSAVFAQDEATSVVWGMPGTVVKRGLAHRVLPLGDMAGAIRGKLKG